jgi:hypothetical protein
MFATLTPSLQSSSAPSDTRAVVPAAIEEFAARGAWVNRLKTLIACAFLSGLVGSAAAPNVAFADARTDYLARTLATSDSFRVRVQACLSLGQARPTSQAVIEALSSALRDRHPAVRTAAASALMNLENPSALPALRLARRDNTGEVQRAIDRAIMALQRIAAQRGTSSTTSSSTSSTGTTGTVSRPRGPVRYYVGVGEPGAGNGVGAELVSRAEETLRREVGNVEGVELAPPHESSVAAGQVVRRRRLSGFYIDSSILSVERTAAGTRVQVSVIVGTYPGRDMRAMLRGSATAPGAASAANERLALEGAIRGALRQLPQALAASAESARR